MRRALTLLALLFLPVAGMGGERLITLDGKTLLGEVTGISAAGAVTCTAGDGPVTHESIWRIERPGPAPKAGSKAEPATAASFWVLLQDGSRLRAQAVLVEAGACRVALSWGEAMSVPLKQVRGFWRADASPGHEETIRAALAGEAQEQDRIFALQEDALRAVPGILKRVDETRVTLQYQDQERSIGRDKVFGVILAGGVAAAAAEALWRADLADGSDVRGELQGLAEGSLRLRLFGESELSLPWSQVISLQALSDRIAYLSDRDPATVEQQAIVTFAARWQRDQNLFGALLQIQGQRFAKGIAVHARSLLTYDLQGRAEFFLATIGLDRSAEGKGDCLFRVLGDGRVLFEQRVRGTDAPRDIRVAVREVNRLTLAVEPGENLDLADHADWCDARLVR